MKKKSKKLKCLSCGKIREGRIRNYHVKDSTSSFYVVKCLPCLRKEVCKKMLRVNIRRKYNDLRKQDIEASRIYLLFRKNKFVETENLKKYLFYKCTVCDKSIFVNSLHNFLNRRLDGKIKICKSCKNSSIERKKFLSSLHLGKNNPMAGVNLNEYWLKKYGKEEATKRRVATSKKISQSNSGKCIPSKIRRGAENGMFGKTPYGIWLKKYGKEEADLRQVQMVKNHKEKVLKGKNNPMYGKPTPSGSGSGYSGWYKDIYFRSFHELSYFVKIIERHDILCESAEKVKWVIKYIDEKGSDRTYRADFVLNNKYLVEIKPKKMRNLREVLLKEKFAIDFCKEHNLIYKITSVSLLKKEKIKEMYDCGKIKLQGRSDERYRKKYAS